MPKTPEEMAKEVLLRHYDPDSKLYKSLLIHSRCVADKALRCAAARGIDVDLRFVEEAALLHDIGIIRCHAPSIHCTGSLPYICHGVEGRKMLEAEGLPRHALVCERHTGSGLTADEIAAADMPLPHRDMLPVSTEERLICYADKFFSKSGELDREKPLEQVIGQMERFGEGPLQRFLDLHAEFGS